jgi:hypothetical protein
MKDGYIIEAGVLVVLCIMELNDIEHYVSFAGEVKLPWQQHEQA